MDLVDGTALCSVLLSCNYLLNPNFVVYLIKNAMTNFAMHHAIAATFRHTDWWHLVYLWWSVYFDAHWKYLEHFEDCENFSAIFFYLTAWSLLCSSSFSISKAGLLQLLSLVCVNSESDAVRWAESLCGELDDRHTTLDQRTWNVGPRAGLLWKVDRAGRQSLSAHWPAAAHTDNTSTQSSSCGVSLTL